jgi:hypothetical protein
MEVANPSLVTCLPMNESAVAGRSPTAPKFCAGGSLASIAEIQDGPLTSDIAHPTSCPLFLT